MTRQRTVSRQLKFLFLEPFFGGSHRDFANGLVKHSRHKIELVTLPPRFWKWRMRGAALHFVHKVPHIDKYDGLIITNLMSLADFKALQQGDFPPTLAYFHENQLTYPLAPGERIDYQFGFTDITTALTAQKVLFNSATHREAFLSRLPKFIKMMPEYLPLWVVDAIASKSKILHPGCHFSAKDAPPIAPNNSQGKDAPLIIWNHRWEFDKDPDTFFDALGCLHDEGIKFRLALLGENFQIVPKAFLAARQKFPDLIVQYGYVSSRKDYYDWLKRGTVVVSTARQENFGISVVEAMHFGCMALLPRRLSYPEIVPSEYHRNLIYTDFDDLTARLKAILTAPEKHNALRHKIARSMDKFSWSNCIDRYDDALNQLVHSPACS